MTVRLVIDFTTAGQAANELRGLRNELDQTRRGLDDTSRGFDEAESGAEGFRATLSPVAVAIGAVTAAAVAGALALRRLASESVEGRKDFVRLDHALRGAGHEFDSTDDAIQGFFDTLQSTTRFAGGEAAAALARITTRTANYGVSQQQLITITQLAADVAEQQGRSLDQSGELVVRALEGNTRAMRDLGIQADNADDAMEQLIQRFGGASAQIDDYEQATVRLENAKNDLFRFMGDGIRTNEALINSFRSAARVVEALSDVFDRSNESTAGLRQQLAAIIPVVDGAGASTEQLARSTGILVQGGAVAINTVRALEIGYLGLRAAAVAAAVGALHLATATGQGIVAVLTGAIRVVEGFITALAGIAGVVPGLDGAERALRTVQSAVAGLGDTGSETMRHISGFREELRRTAQEDAANARDRIVELANAMADTSNAAAEFRRQFEALLAEAGDEVEREDVLAVAMRADWSMITEDAEEAAAAVKEVADEIDRDAERRAREEERRRERLAQAVQRAERDALDTRLGFLDEEEQAMHLLMEARRAFGIEMLNEEVDFDRKAAELQRQIREAQTEDEVEEYQRRLEILRDFHSQQLAAEEAAARESERMRREQEARMQRLAGNISQASAAMGAAVANVFAGADTGETFSRLIRQQIGSILTAQGGQMIFTGLSQQIPGPNFNPPAGAANIALGVGASVLGGALGGASVATPASPPAAAAPAPVDVDRGAPGDGMGGDVTIVNQFGQAADPVQSSREIERTRERGRRAGIQ